MGQKSEQVLSTGRKITDADRGELLRRLKILLLKDADVVEKDINAFAVDLDNDGKQEIVFVASNLERIADHYPDDIKASKPVPYFVYGGILASDTQVPKSFTMEEVTILDLPTIVVMSRSRALSQFHPEPASLHYSSMAMGKEEAKWRGLLQKIDTIEFVCN